MIYLVTGGLVLLVIISIMTAIYINNRDFIDHLNSCYGGDWYYDEIEGVYKDLLTDRTYERKVTE